MAGDLTDEQFEIFCKINSLEWICPSCVDDECSKCEKLFRHDKRITCNLCYQNYHISCGGLNKQTYPKIDPKSGSVILAIIKYSHSILYRQRK